MMMFWLILLVATLLLGIWLSQRIRRQRALAQGVHRMMEELNARLHEVEAQRNQAQAILESMVEGVLTLDRDGRILWLNASAQQLIGVTAPQAAGKRCTELLRQPELDELIREGVTHQRLAVREVHTFVPEERVLRFHITPYQGGSLDAALVLVVQDVTEVRRLEGMRREFVANVSHELKTPLTSIKGVVETLLNGALQDPANNRRFVSMIEEDATRLTRLIDDLLQLSQVESKAVPLKRETIPLKPFLDTVISSLQRDIDQRHLTVRLDIPSDATVLADTDRFRQVMLNVVDNAIKYNKERGQITISTERGPNHVTMRIADTGVGIPPQDLPRIFERFYRVDKARSRELGGTGLGLSIVKHIVEAHGGTVSVQSGAGAGSVFTVTLPLA